MKLRILAAALLCAGLSHAPAFGQTTILPAGETCFSATAGLNGMIGLLGSIAGGSGYVNGTYGGVPVTGGSGSGATANVTVSSGSVSGISILNPGTQYVVGDVLSVAAANIGGSGSGLSFPVASISVNSNLAAGTVGFYVPNTLTFKTTWKNSGQTIANTNPVRLDANGCALIYGLGSYRQIVKDSLGNTVWDALTASTAALSTAPATSGAGDFLAVGTVIPIAAFSAPLNYVLAYGQAISRTTYPDALTALTISSSASCVSTSTTVSGLATTAQMRVGAPIEASCLTPGTTIATIAGPTSVTVSIAAVSTSSPTVRVFPWGNGDGSTTFNVPDLRGRVVVGPDAMGGVAASRITTPVFGISAGPPGAAGGLQSETISQAQLPSYTLPDTLGVTVTDNRTWALTGAKGVVAHVAGDNSVANNIGFDTVTSAAVTVSGGTISGAKTGSVTSGGSGSPLATIQPMLTINYAIKVLNGTLPTVGVLSFGGMTGDIACGTGFTCAAQTVGLNFTPGTMASQNANSVVISGGTIDGTAIGNTVTAPGNFSALAINGTPVGTSTSSFWSAGGGGAGSPIQYNGGRVNIGAGAAITTFAVAGVVTNAAGGVLSSSPSYTKSMIYAADNGVTADGVTDDTLALIAAVARCNNSVNATYKGGRLELPLGRIVVTLANLPADGIDISNCTEIGGAGSAGGFGGTLAGTEIYTTCTTCNIFIHSSLTPPYLHDFAVNRPYLSTAGYSVWVKTSVAASAGHGMRIERMRFEGGFIQLQLLSEANYSIAFNQFIDAALKMVYTTIDPACSCGGDLGDSVFVGNVFQEIFNTGLAGSAALHINPGAGIAVGPNKFTTAASGAGSLQHLIQVTMDHTVTTGTLVIGDNSIEGGAIDAIRVERTAGLGNYANINIHDNEFGGANVSGGSAISFNVSGSSYIQRCSIHHNIFQYSTLGAPVILVQDCPRADISDNQIQPPGGPSTTGITVSNFAANAIVKNNEIVAGAALYPALLATTVLIHPRGFTFAELTAIGAVANGSQVLVSDGKATNVAGANYVLTSGGPGCFAVRIAGGWIVGGVQ
jgi:microcystin-dependent protein